MCTIFMHITHDRYEALSRFRPQDSHSNTDYENGMTTARKGMASAAEEMGQEFDCLGAIELKGNDYPMAIVACGLYEVQEPAPTNKDPIRADFRGLKKYTETLQKQTAKVQCSKRMKHLEPHVRDRGGGYPAGVKQALEQSQQIHHTVVDQLQHDLFPRALAWGSVPNTLNGSPSQSITRVTSRDHYRINVLEALPAADT
ncbi:hypothetical protein CHS0354_009411 [Potamilus streckersoni]|uniref:Uncharacterized protein n=1 Tax=Potamilus streckersoni TaxID=2493646 RepID=A0AAE0T583_9BIVA|nr:hypothetical protein CHS0354_009411 [Potamilus streckersoni]